MVTQLLPTVGKRTLKTDRELGGKGSLGVIGDKIPFRDAVLQFELGMSGKAVTESEVDPGHVMRVRDWLAGGIGSGIEKLLVPAQRPKELGRKFVLQFQIISEDIGIP
jgi:hypothetical protein